MPGAVEPRTPAKIPGHPQCCTAVRIGVGVGVGCGVPASCLPQNATADITMTISKTKPTLLLVVIAVPFPLGDFSAWFRMDSNHAHVHPTSGARLRSCVTLLPAKPRCRTFVTTARRGAAFAFGGTPHRGPDLASTVASLATAGFPLGGFGADSLALVT